MTDPILTASEAGAIAVAAALTAATKAAKITADHRIALSAEVERLREALTVMVRDVEEWCEAVNADSSWDGWDHHYKHFAYGTGGGISGLDAARAALAPTQETT